MSKVSKEEWKVYKNVFDKFTIKTIFKLITQGYFDGLTSPVEIGKEANVFMAKKNQENIIVKVYRLESSNFNKMYDYIKYDPRYLQMKKQKRKVIFSWVQREYRNLLIAREVINVPTPHAFRNNVLVMEMIGKSTPSLQLKDNLPENPEIFFDEIIESLKKLYKKGLVHGDLSQFNILNHHERPYFIDFSQGTSTQAPNANELLERDLRNICNFFKKNGIKKDYENIFKKIIKNS